ncbi:MAG: sigma-70 family RNA polymerase sigma factor [Cycloclasticus sp.]|nr:sigma-70 family RNA polymerase sigma factor [Cycloclasticus sp.]
MQEKKKQLEYERLVLVYSDDLFRYALWRCRDKSMAEDLVQETCLRAWKSLDKLRDVSSSKAWLMTILRNEHARLYTRYQPNMVDMELDTVSLRDTDNDTSPEAFALKQALAELSEDYREPLLLQVVGGLSCEEIASVCNISKSATMTRLFRAKQKLRDVLRPEDGQVGA